MKERGILFSAPMVRAILDGRKSQTRRVVKPQPEEKHEAYIGSWLWQGGKSLVKAGYGAPYVHSDWTAVERAMLKVCQYGQPGERLWVKETFYCDDYRYPEIPADETSDADWKNRMLYYRADGEDLCHQIPECDCSETKGCWRPSIFMPRWASRIALELAAVRVERLQAITEEDAIAEGIENPNAVDASDLRTCKEAYSALWDSLNAKKHPWSSNPWVWVLEFRRVEK